MDCHCHRFSRSGDDGHIRRLCPVTMKAFRARTPLSRRCNAHGLFQRNSPAAENDHHPFRGFSRGCCICICILSVRLAAVYADRSILPFLIALSWFLVVMGRLILGQKLPCHRSVGSFILPLVATATAIVLTGATKPPESAFWSAGDTWIAELFREIRDLAHPVAFLGLHFLPWNGGVRILRHARFSPQPVHPAARPSSAKWGTLVGTIPRSM